jgi:hypothetical protein
MSSVDPTALQKALLDANAELAICRQQLQDSKQEARSERANANFRVHQLTRTENRLTEALRALYAADPETYGRLVRLADSPSNFGDNSGPGGMSLECASRGFRCDPPSSVVARGLLSVTGREHTPGPHLRHSDAIPPSSFGGAVMVPLSQRSLLVPPRTSPDSRRPPPLPAALERRASPSDIMDPRSSSERGRVRPPPDPRAGRSTAAGGVFAAPGVYGTPGFRIPLLRDTVGAADPVSLGPGGQRRGPAGLPSSTAPDPTRRPSTSFDRPARPLSPPGGARRAASQEPLPDSDIEVVHMGPTDPLRRQLRPPSPPPHRPPDVARSPESSPRHKKKKKSKGKDRDEERRGGKRKDKDQDRDRDRGGRKDRGDGRGRNVGKHSDRHHHSRR